MLDRICKYLKLHNESWKRGIINVHSQVISDYIMPSSSV